MRTILLISASALVLTNVAWSDIYQWEYINPADPSQGTRQSTILAPDGAAIEAVPGADFSYRNLKMAYLVGADLTDVNGQSAILSGAAFQGADLAAARFTAATLDDANFGMANLTSATLSVAKLVGANFEKADLTNAQLDWAHLTGATFKHANLTNANLSTFDLADVDFSDAEIRGARLDQYGLTLAQLYSTASFKARDLQGIRADNDLAGGDFSNQNLANATFGKANLTGASFRAANLTQVQFSADYPCGGSSPFGGKNSSCSPSHILRSSTLTGADFTEANIQGSNFNRQSASEGTGLSLAQLYSTASYQTGDLRGIGLSYNDLTSADFEGLNLDNADLGAALLTGANLRGASLTNVNFVKWHYVPCLMGFCFGSLPFFFPEYAALNGADLTGADARGADFELRDAITNNLIMPDGHIEGLHLIGSDLLVVRDYDGAPSDPPQLIPITINDHFLIGPGGTLRMVFEADAWDSTISYAPGIPVTLGGTLELTFADDVNPATQLGRTFDLFDWTGVTPTGAFAVSSPYVWDLSNIYTAGEVTLNMIPEPTALVLLLVGVVLMIAPRRVRFVLSAVLICGHVPSAFAELPMTGTPIPELQAVEMLLQDFMLGKPIPGGTIAITHNDKVVYERGIGYSNDARTIPMQETALMRLASVSKPITASAIQQLASDGQLSLDDKVFDIDGNGGILNITPYNGTLGDSRLRDITLQHLLEHKGGWNREIAGDIAFEDVHIAATMGVPSPPGIDNSARYIVSQPLQFTPGSAEYYSNIGYMFLGMIVEAASGQAYEDYVDNHVLAPAGIPVWEVDAGRTFSVDQNPREPLYSDPATYPNVFDPAGPLVPVPYGGWDHEKALAFGGLIASSKAIALLAQNRIASGPEIGKLRSESTTNPQNIGGHLGVLPGTLTLMVQESSTDWTYSILFDGLPADWSSSAFSLFDSLNQTLDGLTTWPEAFVYAGDFTNDQWLTFDDVTLFKQALALGTEEAFAINFPTARYDAGDFDGDGHVNATDAVGFISALQHAGVPAEYSYLVANFPGDYNIDGKVDAADYTVWRDNIGADALINRGVGVSGPVGDIDYAVWKANFGQSLGVGGGSSTAPSAIPEPTAMILVLAALVCGLATSRRAYRGQ